MGESRRSRFATVLDTTASLAMIATAIVMFAAFAIDRGWLPSLRNSPRNSAGHESVSENAQAIDISKTALARRRASARVAIVEFSDFQCPFCGKYAREVYPAIRSKFVDTGRVDYVFRHFPLGGMHPQAISAAIAAQCAARQDKGWEMHDRFFADQRRLGAANFDEDARALALDEAAFKRCVSGDENEHLRQDLEEGRRLSVQGTPTFFIGVLNADDSVRVTHRLSGAQPFERFAEAIESAAKSISEE